jgi:hypothetical protein
METLSGFDTVVASDPDIGFTAVPYYAQDTNPGRTQTLLQIIRGRLFRAQYGAEYGRGGLIPQQKQRNELDVYEIEISNVQERYLALKRQFKFDEQTLPGLADERLSLFIRGLNPEPLLRDQDEDDAFMERVFVAALDDMGDRGVVRRAIAGERHDAEEERRFERAVNFLRGEADRLHSEVVDRLRLEQRSLKARVREAVKSAPKKLVAAYAAAALGLIVTGSLAYAKNWIWHHARHRKLPPADTSPSPTTPTTTPSSRTTTRTP